MAHRPVPVANLVTKLSTKLAHPPTTATGVSDTDLDAGPVKVRRGPWATKLHCFNVAQVANRYLETPQDRPILIYDKTSQLQLVKPYNMFIRTQLNAKSAHLTLQQWLAETAHVPVAKSQRMQHLIALIESGIVTVDGLKVSPCMLLRGRSHVTRVHHRHEEPVPLFRVDQIVPQSLGHRTLRSVDKPPGLPCVTDMRRHFYNSLPYMLHVFGLLPSYKSVLFNNIGTASGVVLLTANVHQAAKLAGEVAAGRVRFEYLARVYGDVRGVEGMEVLERGPWSSLIRVESNSENLETVLHDLARRGHPVLNDWHNLRTVHSEAYITRSLELAFGSPRVDALFSKTRLLEKSSMQREGCNIMLDPLARERAPHIIPPSLLDLTPELSRYYNEHARAVHSAGKVGMCAECGVNRLPLPVNLMAPTIHLQSVRGSQFEVESRFPPAWL